jgi:hypothetical protein
MTRMSQVQGHMTNLAANRGNVPILRLALGLLLIAFFLLALMLQVQTSESFILQGNVVSFGANWGILAQPLDLLQGKLPVDLAKAVMWGWGIELVYLVVVIGEVTMNNTRLIGWFRTGAIVLVGFDFWTDFQYGSLASGLWGQAAFAGVTAFIVAFFGVVGFNMVWSAILEWNR